MTPPVVSYKLDDDTVVRFEVEPTGDWRNVGTDRVVGQIKEAVEPAIEGARAVLDKAKDLAPDEVVVKFGIKVSGTMSWVVAKAATEGNFEVALTWKSHGGGE